MTSTFGANIVVAETNVQYYPIHECILVWYWPIKQYNSEENFLILLDYIYMECIQFYTFIYLSVQCQYKYSIVLMQHLIIWIDIQTGKHIGTHIHFELYIKYTSWGAKAAMVQKLNKD